MTHTAELHIQITRQEYDKLLSRTEKTPEREKKTGETRYHIRTLENVGITDICPKKAIKRNGTVYYYCVIIINLQRIINDGKRTIETYTDENDIEKLSRNFCRYIFAFLPSHTNINEWSLQRIDYNIDIRMKPKETERYIALLQRGGKAHSWSIHEGIEDKAKRQKNKHGKDTISHPNGSVLFDNKQYSVNIYDKQLERISKQKKRGITDEKELKESEGILRIEVQAKNNKIRSIKRRFEDRTEGKPIERFARYEIAIPTIMKVLKEIAGEADYMTLTSARAKIEKSKYREQTKRDSITFLQAVNTKRSFWKAKKEYRGKTRINTVLKTLSSLNINPVTIPKSFGVDYMPNLFHSVAVRFAEQRYNTTLL